MNSANIKLHTCDSECSAICCKEDCTFYSATGLRNILPTNFFPSFHCVQKIYISFSKRNLKPWKRKSVLCHSWLYKHPLLSHWVSMLMNFRTRCSTPNHQNFFPYWLGIQSFAWSFFSVNKLFHKYSFKIR